MGFTTDDLINSVRVRGMLPDSSTGSYSNESILTLANEELKLTIVPLIISAREKYYEYVTDYNLEADKSFYPIPERACGGIVSSIQYILDNQVVHLNPIDAQSVRTLQPGIRPMGFYFQNNDIVVFPTPAVTQGTLRVIYPKATSNLTLTNKAAQILEVNYTDKTVKIQALPDARWSGAFLVDFVSRKAPYSPIAIDQIVNNITEGVSDYTISFPELPMRGIEGLVQVGDWVTIANETPIPEIMNEFFSILSEATICKVYESEGNSEAFQKSMSRFAEYSQRALKLITPRDSFGLKKVCSNWRNW